MRQADGRYIYAGTRNDTVLDRDIVKVVVSNVGRGLDLNQTPATVPTPMQDVHFHENILVLKHSFENC